jgi:hypothetical protein
VNFHGRGELKHPELQAALVGAAGYRGQINGPQLGKWFQKMKGRIVNGMRLVCEPDPKRGNRWYLETDAGGDEAGFTPLSPDFPQDENEPEFKEMDS